MFCHNIHCHFAEEKVCTDPRCCRNTSGLDDIQNNLHGEIVDCQLIGIQIVCHIHENLVNGVDNNVLRRNILEIHFINPRTVLHVVGHTRRCDDKINRKLGIGLQFGLKM